MLKQLPPESATATIVRLNEVFDYAGVHDPEAEQWSRDQQLAASIRDELHFLRHAYTTVHAGKNRVKWKPEPLPRPGVSSTSKKRAIVTDEQAESLWRHLQSTQPE